MEINLPGHTEMQMLMQRRQRQIRWLMRRQSLRQTLMQTEMQLGLRFAQFEKVK